MKTIKELLKDVEILEKKGSVEVLSSKALGITEDSREIKPGYIFVAKKGTNLNGETFIPDAIKRGASVVIKEGPLKNGIPEGVLQLRVRDTKKVLSILALRFFGDPQKRIKLIGVTGTNGKTSVSWFLKQCLSLKGNPVGYTGTIGYDVGSFFRAKETTPGIVEFARLLKEAAENKLEWIVSEVSSHALSQDRIRGLNFEVGVFTNLSHDHLDYHGSMEEYYQAKRRLFEVYVAEEKPCVISLETPWGERLKEELKRYYPKKKVFTTNHPEFFVRLRRGCKDPIFELVTKNGVYPFVSQVVGGYQLKNLATVAGVLLVLGWQEKEIVEAFEVLKNPPGRLELVGHFKGADIFVDYAHTPEALKEAILTLKEAFRKKLLLVFGCGGNRDKEKRPEMGKIACELADYSIITSDNPRWEDPEKIVRDIEKGFFEKRYTVILDRREAIARAIERLEPGWVLLIAGKGHEDYQEVMGKRHPFSDSQVVKEIIGRT